MINKTLIKRAVRLIIEIEEAEGIIEQTSNVEARVLDWYNNTEITSAEMLAAASMLGDYSKDIKYDDIVRLCENYFYDEEPARKAGYYDTDFSIGEIEDSYRDYFWR